MDIDYQVLPTFAKIHRDPNPFLFVMGPVGSGKSSGCIFQAFFNATNMESGTADTSLSAQRTRP